MTPERHQKAGHLYHAALEVEPASRAAFLDAACGDDLELRGEVESLLAAHDNVGKYFGRPALEVAAGMLANHQNPSLVGQSLSHYRVLKMIGAGGMGEVYLAEDTHLKRKVALKLLPKEFTEDHGRARRFVREARAASSLNHPNILTIHEIGDADGAQYIVSEFVEGETLRSLMLRDQLELSKATAIVEQVASALGAAHAAGIIHRDIKPENVMVRRDGLVKVLDFGLAKLVDAQSPPVYSRASTLDKLSTEAGLVMGTVNYMSPEQARGLKLDHRTDIFSLGVMLYEMATGRRPFEGETASDVIAAILQKDPVPVSQASQKSLPEIDRVISRMIEKDRDARYQSAVELITELNALRMGSEEGKAAAPRVEAAGARFGSWRWRLAAVVAAILICALVLFLVWRSRPAALPDQIKSLAVIPLDNFSGDPGQDYLADGMTEALITELSKIGSLRVISRTSVMQYKAARKPLPEIGRELNVDVIVAGSVQRSGDRIGISAQLIRAATDQHLWADQYERDLRDVLSLQREVARAIAGEINVKLTPKEQGLMASAGPVDPGALDAYLKGRDYLNRGRDHFGQQGTDWLKTSVDYFEQAVRIDPNFALGHAGLASAFTWLADSRGLSEFLPRAKEAVERALEIDETLSQAHGLRAHLLLTFDWDWAGSEREIIRAIELDPNSGVHGNYSMYLSYLGRFDEAIREMNLNLELSPLTVFSKYNAGIMYIWARQPDRAIEQFRRVLDAQPNHAWARLNLGRAYLKKGMYDEGMAELRKAIEFSGGSASARATLAWGYAVSGNRSAAIKILDESSKSSEDGDLKVAVASAYTALGDRDQAFAWLEKAYQERSPLVLIIKSDPDFDGLRSDPRYNDLLRRIGFPQ